MILGLEVTSRPQRSGLRRIVRPLRREAAHIVVPSLSSYHRASLPPFLYIVVVVTVLRGLGCLHLALLNDAAFKVAIFRRLVVSLRVLGIFLKPSFVILQYLGTG